MTHPSGPRAAAPKKRRGIFSALIVTLAAAGLAVTIAGGFANHHWLADLLAQFKLHWALGLFLLLFLLAVLRRWGWCVACLVGLLVNLIPVWPYWMPPPRDMSQGTADGATTEASFRLLSFNVLTTNRRYDEVIEFLENESADFVILMEVDAAWKSVLDDLSESYGFTRFETREDNFGIAFLSKHAWSNIEVFYSRSLQLPSIDVRVEQINGVGLSKPLRIIGTHPIPPLPPNGRMHTAIRNEQLIDVSSRFDEATQNVMAGDFNLTPWSPVFADVLKEGGLRDSARGYGVEPSWYVFPSWIGGLKLDHVLVGPELQVLRHRIGPDIGSDHRPVVVDLKYEKDLKLGKDLKLDK